MKLSKSRIEIGFLRSKLARRIFLLFILCALVPLSALAFLAFTQVKSELNSQADRRLHRASKSAGMTVFERLSFLEVDLNIIISNLPVEQPDDLDFALRDLRKRLIERFRSLALVTPDGEITAYYGAKPQLPAPREGERLHLEAGKTLVTTRSNPHGVANTFIAKNFITAQSTQRFLFGEIQSDYLWGGEGFLDPMTEICALGKDGELLFTSFGGRLPLPELESARKKEPQSGRFEWAYDENSYLASYWTLFMRPTYFDTWILVHSEKRGDVLEPLYSFSKTFLLLVLLSFWIVSFLSLNQIRRSMVPIERLRKATERVKAKDFKSRVRIKSGDEFEELGESFNEMTESLENHLKIMNTINRIGVSLSAEKNDNQLLEVILRGAKSVVNADGAALYLMTEDSRLELAMMHISSLDLWVGSSSEQAFTLFDILGNSDTTHAGAPLALRDETINIEDIYAAEEFDFTGLKNFDSNAGYRSRSFLSVSLKDHDNEIIGVLQLINATGRSSREIVAFSTEDQRLAESLASQTAVALTKNRLVQDFKRLFEGLTELIGTAIDEKSPYTGEHCKRVPVLTMMLAEAASKSDEAPFKDFSLSPEEEYELRIAALLHDCGKVTTPVHIADKATKLEAIVDRIDLVENRFEILKRDKQIELLSASLHTRDGTGQDIRKTEDELAKYCTQLDEEIEFLKRCNSGTEFMPEDHRTRVMEIAYKYGWERPNGERRPILSHDEVVNLTIPSGTLTREERGIVNYHIVSTIKMLESLPYPKNLRNVPAHAGSHHERMDGKGYPLGLTRDQISMQGRIIAIADIFEALTATDRPYKKAKTLSEALEILRTMNADGQIDPDLYHLFMGEKLYLRYAEQFLDPEQIDILEREAGSMSAPQR